MKFVTEGLVKGVARKYEVPFDPELISIIEIDKDEGIIIVQYDVQGDPLFSSWQRSKPIHVIKVTNNDLYWSAAYHFHENALSSQFLKNYVDEYGTTGFTVLLTESEKMKVLLALTKNLIK